MDATPLSHPFSLIFIFITCWNCIYATEFFVYLTQENESGSYKLHYYNKATSGNGNWTSIAVPDTIRNIEDVEFNYITRYFYFTSSQPGNKGIWKGTLDLKEVYKSHQLREETTPITLRAYPEYEVAFVYDAGYHSILAISLRNEKDDLRIKSLFQPAEGLHGTFFLDKLKNRLIAENTSNAIFTSKLNGISFRFEFSLPAEYAKDELLAYDDYNATLYYCVDGALLGMKIDGQDPIPAENVPCNSLVASRGVVYYTNATSNSIMTLKLNNPGVEVTNSSYLKIEHFNSSTSKIIAFKRYEYNQTTKGKCGLLNCSQICVPDDETGRPVCTCTDYHSTTSFPNGTVSCAKDTLHSLSIIYAVSIVSNNTLFYRLEGTPKEWIRRAQREQLFTIRSGIVGLAVDWDNERLLIAETQYRQIASAKMDGSFQTMAHYAGLSAGVKSIVFDWVGGNVVWFDPVFHWLRIVPLTDYHNILSSPDAAVSSIFSLSSANVYKTALSTSELEGYSLSLDAHAGYLFFLDLNDVDMTIHVWRTLMDGSKPQKIYTLPQNVYDNEDVDLEPDRPLPGSLTVDFYKQHIWVAFTNDVFILDYDGTVVARLSIEPGNLAINNSRVESAAVYQSNYLLLALLDIPADTSSLFVYSIQNHTNGSCCAELRQEHTRKLNGQFRALTVYQDTPKITPELNCSSINCEYMCTNMNGKATCICPDGYSWNSTHSQCYINQTVPASPVVVYNTQEKICYRSLDTIGNPPATMSSFLLDADFCFQNGKKMYSIMEPDHFAYKLYAVQKNHMPAAIYSLRLRQANRVFEWLSLPPLTSLLTSDSAPEEWDVFYSGNTVVALAFDWLARNLYIADQSSQSLVVLRDNYYYPTLLHESVNITSLVVDALRRKMYWTAYSNVTNISTIVQRNLDATGECELARVNASISQMHISYSNHTLLWLERPYNRLGEISIRGLPPFADCQKVAPTYYKLAKENVTQFVVYQRMMLFSTSNPELKLFMSTSRGLLMDHTVALRKLAIPSAGMRGPIKSLAVVNPYLFSNMSELNPSDLSMRDKCAALDHGQCEHLCLASWDGNRTKSHCACTDGMVLLADDRTCAPRPIDLLNVGAIISVDDYFHKVFMLPLSTLGAGRTSFTVQNNLSALFIHAKARPYSVAIDSATSEIYFGDHERGSIIRVNPHKQMTRKPHQGHMEETVVSLGNKVYGLFIDPNARLLFYTHREGHYLGVLDMDTKEYGPIYTADSYTSFYGVVMDHRPKKMHLYVATRNVSAMPPGSGNSANFKPSTWSAIVRCMPNGDHCKTVVNFTAVGEQTKSVPWIYELSIDFKENKLYFSTGQNRSIMYLELDKVDSCMPNCTAKLFAQEGAANEQSFIYGCQVYDDYLLATDWQNRGIHVFNLRSSEKNKKTSVIGGSFFTGLNGIVVFSRQHQDKYPFSDVCSSTFKFCSHICVPMSNKERACVCPQGGKAVDGVNCNGVAACPLPDRGYGTFNKDCTFRPNRTCTFTCANNSQILDNIRLKEFPITCLETPEAKWSQSIDSVCPMFPSTPSPAKVNTLKTSTKSTQKVSPTAVPTVVSRPLTSTKRNLVGMTENAVSSETWATSNAGIIVGIILCAVLLAGLTVGLLVYFKRRPNARGFRRLDDPPGNLIAGSAAVASGLPAGTVAFRNPIFGMDDIDNVTVVDPRVQQQHNQQQPTQPQQQTGAREGQVVIF